MLAGPLRIEIASIPITSDRAAQHGGPARPCTASSALTVCQSSLNSFATSLMVACRHRRLMCQAKRLVQNGLSARKSSYSVFTLSQRPQLRRLTSRSIQTRVSPQDRSRTRLGLRPYKPSCVEPHAPQTVSSPAERG